MSQPKVTKQVKDVMLKTLLKHIDSLTRISVDIELMSDDDTLEAKRALVDRIAQVKDESETIGTYAETYLRN